VLCDRFVDSSRVYQGGSGEIDRVFMAALERVSVNGMMPDLTLIFDIDPALGMQRAEARRGDDAADRFEKETLAVHRRRREAYLEIARKEPERCIVIDASQPVETVEHAVTEAVFRTVEARFASARGQAQEA